MAKKTNNLQFKTDDLSPRPPIVVVMGHVDHGKTTLLDYIRKTNVAGREAGGITQSIGAYEIIRESTIGEPKKITFVDTPGHEAFSKMRARGAKVADLAILVVAADDGVKPQTKEAIELLRQAETPFVVAINKIDKNNADVGRIKQELSQSGVLLEGYGGDISWQAISAKRGEGINELLDLILLVAEVAGLTYGPQAPASGIIIESKMESRRGLEAMAIVKNGTLKVGDDIQTKTAKGRVKVLENFLGERVAELEPSSPALILGFEILPQIGEEFWHANPEAEQVRYGAGSAPAPMQIVNPDEVVSKESQLVKVFLKADVGGSLEALSGAVKNLPNVKVVYEGIGEINDGDIRNALSLGAVVVGFKVKAGKTAQGVAKAKGVAVINSEIIYELLKVLEEKIISLKEPAPQGRMTILAVFSQRGNRQVIGGLVEEGAMRVNVRVKIMRGGKELGQGKITNLQKGKKDAGRVEAGEECGVLIESGEPIQAGDELIHQ